MSAPFRSAAYWEARYRSGHGSGAGSYGRLAAWKAAFVNGLIELNDVRHVADFGCGDGNLLSMLRTPAYTGLDVSQTALNSCAARFPQHRFLPFARAGELRPAELCLSMDVIYHLIEDEVFETYTAELFARAMRLVAIYASNVELGWPSPHVRHRRFTDHVASRIAGWRLCAHAPNPYPYDPARPDETSFADFFLYAREGEGCALTLPSSSARS